MRSSVTINIIYSRHGFSCGNLNSSLKYINSEWNHGAKNVDDDHDDKMLDPGLTVEGVKCTVEAAEHIKAELKRRKIKIDMLAASALIRAMETAMTLFKNELINEDWRVNVLPHMTESGNHPNNIAITREEQVEILENDENFWDLDFRSENPMLIWRFPEEMQAKSDIKQFLAWLVKNVELKNNLTLFVVSHGNFIREQVLNTTYILDNNDTVLVRYGLFNREENQRLEKLGHEWIWKRSESDSKFMKRVECDVCRY
jgi:broad specificity phosphatase PhoE